MILDYVTEYCSESGNKTRDKQEIILKDEEKEAGVISFHFTIVPKLK